MNVCLSLCLFVCLCIRKSAGKALAFSPIIAVTTAANWHIKLHLVVCVVGLDFAQIPGNSRGPEHYTTVTHILGKQKCCKESLTFNHLLSQIVSQTRSKITYSTNSTNIFIYLFTFIGSQKYTPEAVIEGLLCGHHANVLKSSLPDTVVGQQL